MVLDTIQGMEVISFLQQIPGPKREEYQGGEPTLWSSPTCEHSACLDGWVVVSPDLFYVKCLEYPLVL